MSNEVLEMIDFITDGGVDVLYEDLPEIVFPLLVRSLEFLTLNMNL